MPDLFSYELYNLPPSYFSLLSSNPFYVQQRIFLVVFSGLFWTPIVVHLVYRERGAALWDHDYWGPEWGKQNNDVPGQGYCEWMMPDWFMMEPVNSVGCVCAWGGG